MKGMHERKTDWKESRKSVNSTNSMRKSITSLVSSGRVSMLEQRRTTLSTLIEMRSSIRKKDYTEIILETVPLGVLVIATFLSISCAVVGAIYWSHCPGNKILPVLLVLRLPLTGTEVGAAYIMLARNYEWVRNLVSGECMNKIHTATGFLFITSGLWFSILALWVFEGGLSFDPSHHNYCHQHLYEFAHAYVIIVITVFITLILLFFFACLALAVLLLINKKLKTNEPEVKRTKKQSTVTYGETSFAPDNVMSLKEHGLLK